MAGALCQAFSQSLVEAGYCKRGMLWNPGDWGHTLKMHPQHPSKMLKTRENQMQGEGEAQKYSNISDRIRF
jgi:hypothetical protein